MKDTYVYGCMNSMRTSTLYNILNEMPSRFYAGHNLLQDEKCLETGQKHQPIPDRHDHHEDEYRRRHAPCDEMLNLQVPHTSLIVLHHDGSCESVSLDEVKSIIANLLIFGNPLVGKPIAAEHISTLAMTNKLGCGSLIF